MHMEQDRKEISRFLRNARQRLNPEDFGITGSGRRRTPGLRREEVATLAGISLTWYTWFEQGRNIRPSTEVLENLAVVLRLDEKEREFLFQLAQGRPSPLSPNLHNEISRGTRILLDTVNVPAMVMNEHWSVIGWNRLVTRILRDYGAVPFPERNLFKILLSTDAYKQNPEEYQRMVKRLTARLRWDYSRAKDRTFFDKLIAEARAEHPIFDECWQSPDILDRFEASHSLDVPGVGRVDLRHTSYAIEGALGQRMVLYAPENEDSRARIAKVQAQLEAEGAAAPSA